MGSAITASNNTDSKLSISDPIHFAPLEYLKLHCTQIRLLLRSLCCKVQDVQCITTFTFGLTLQKHKRFPEIHGNKYLFLTLLFLLYFPRRKYTWYVQIQFFSILYVTNVVCYNDMQDLGNLKITSWKKKKKREKNGSINFYSRIFFFFFIKENSKYAL